MLFWKGSLGEIGASEYRFCVIIGQKKRPVTRCIAGVRNVHERTFHGLIFDDNPPLPCSRWVAFARPIAAILSGINGSIYTELDSRESQENAHFSKGKNYQPSSI